MTVTPELDTLLVHVRVERVETGTRTPVTPCGECVVLGVLRAGIAMTWDEEIPLEASLGRLMVDDSLVPSEP